LLLVIMTLLAAAALHFSLVLANGHGYKPYRLCRIAALAPGKWAGASACQPISSLTSETPPKSSTLT